jgi:hypothetical protein
MMFQTEEEKNCFCYFILFFSEERKKSVAIFLQKQKLNFFPFVSAASRFTFQTWIKASDQVSSHNFKKIDKNISTKF